MNQVDAIDPRASGSNLQIENQDEKDVTVGADEELKEVSDGGVRNQASSTNLHATNDA